MNYSEIKPSIYTYLGFKGVQPEARVDSLILKCLEELEEIQQFQYVYKLFENIPEFLNRPPYIAFLTGCTAVILCVTTLGAEVDKKIKYLSRVNLERSVIFDACASALLEYYADEYEKKLGENLTYRFCPGYGGSETGDIKYIFQLLHPEKIGVSLLESNLMLPQKTMAGIIGVGKSAAKSCADCIMVEKCQFRKEGARCYGSVKR